MNQSTSMARQLSARSFHYHFTSGFKKYWQYYVLLLPALAYFIIFCYGPMYGIQIAFKDFNGRDGIWGSPWVGLEHFKRFFEGVYCWDLIKNTLSISLYSLIAGFPLPIILALSVNELRTTWLKKTVQTITYAPYFISTVVMCSMLLAFLNPNYGIINKFIGLFGRDAIPFINKDYMFDSIYVWSGVWQGTGWGSVIYFAALSGVDPSLLEAATLDGATRMQKIRYINFPVLVPTMVIMLILNCGSLLSVGYEKIYLLQTPLNTNLSEVISTYVYKVGLINAQYSYSTAVGLFNSVVNLILLVLVNTFARKVSDTSLW
jgi:ABC-type polysaccharide transport system, permease component